MLVTPYGLMAVWTGLRFRRNASQTDNVSVYGHIPSVSTLDGSPTMRDTAMTTISLLLADDHTLLAESLELFLQSDGRQQP